MTSLKRCSKNQCGYRVCVGRMCVVCVFFVSVWVKGMKAKAPEPWARAGYVCVPSRRLWSRAALPPTLGYGWGWVGGWSGREVWAELWVSPEIAEGSNSQRESSPCQHSKKLYYEDCIHPGELQTGETEVNVLIPAEITEVVRWRTADCLCNPLCSCDAPS